MDGTRRDFEQSVNDGPAGLFFDRRWSATLGCLTCPELPQCGGLSVARPLFNCLDLCTCTSPHKCDNICKRNPRVFVRRLAEVRGFDLDSVPTVAVTAETKLPSVVPIIYHGYSRALPLAWNAVAVPLFDLIDRRSGTIRFHTKEELARSFNISAKALVVATATAKDRPLEAWWGLSQRRAIIKNLLGVGVTMATTPNFSLFSSVPRWDNLYNMKRIAMAWAEMQAHGLLTALHLNARTDADYARWANFIDRQTDLSLVAFEFGTGAGWPLRAEWHVEQLCSLAQRVGRKLTLVVRGGNRYLTQLANFFYRVVVLDTDAFMKTLKRQEATVTSDGRIIWNPTNSGPGIPVDDLLEANVRAVQESVFLRVTDKAACVVG